VNGVGSTCYATDAIAALSDAFRRRDLEAALACFADDPESTYAGSEQGEVAVGPDALRTLFAGVFARDEAYSWATHRVWAAARGDLHTVMAELTGTVHFDSGGAECFAYRVSGVIRVENGTSRWLLCHAAEPTERAS
jgi:ketosteroid isomerase-like protein